MAEIFNDPVHGPEVIDVLSGEFVPQKYEPRRMSMFRVFGSEAGRPENYAMRESGLTSGTGTFLLQTGPEIRHSSQVLTDGPGCSGMMKPGEPPGLGMG
jgi:hypothetical protein